MSPTRCRGRQPRQPIIFIILSRRVANVLACQIVEPSAGSMHRWDARFGLRTKLRPTGARDLSSVLSAIGLATAEGPAEEDGTGTIARKRLPTIVLPMA